MKCINHIWYFTFVLFHEGSVTLPSQLFGHFVIHKNVIFPDINFVLVSDKKYWEVLIN